MINQSQSLMCLSQLCSETVQWAVGRLNQGGLQVLQTFALEGTRGVDTSCTCANHGTDRCDCQMVILLVYGKGSQPVGLMIHGHNGKTWLSLLESFQPSNPVLELQVRKLLVLSDQNPENNGQSKAYSG